MFNKTPHKGMRDFLPQEVEFRNGLLRKIRSAYSAFGFTEVETPCVEDLSLLLSKQGGDNEKLIYKILKRGEKLASAQGDDLADLGLRYELTLSLARYYANNAGNLPSVVKAMQIGNVFRAERPQKGRFCQFIQCDIDIIGEPTIVAEIELINSTVSALRACGLSDFTIKINDRGILKALCDYCGFEPETHEKVLIALDKMDKIGADGVTAELLQFAPQEKVNKLMTVSQEIAASSQPIALCKKYFGDKVSTLDGLQKIIDITSAVFDITLVRGMNYYTGTIFEVWTAFVPYSLAGGGRYDKLIEKITGIPTCACGFSIGFERISALLYEQSKPEKKPAVAVLIDKKDIDDIATVLQRVKQMHESGSICSIYVKSKNVGYQLQKLALQYTTILEYKNGEYIDITR